MEVRGDGGVEPEVNRLNLARPAPRDRHGDPLLGGRVEDKVIELAFVREPVAAEEDESVAAVHQHEFLPLAVGQEREGSVDERRGGPGHAGEAVACRR